MKNILLVFTLFIIGVSNFNYISKTSLYGLFNNTSYNIVNNELYYKKENTKKTYGEYIKYIEKDEVNNVNELYSMFYTVLNNGYDIYTFKCNYNCSNDLDTLNKDTLSNINQLVSVKNSYKSIDTSYDEEYKVTLKINRTYSKEEIERIDNEIDRLIVSLKVNNYNDIEDKIKVFHDYIADHSKYDTDRVYKNDYKYQSNTAIGPLFEGFGICDGYSDLLSFYLDKLDIENIKISNNEHVWNAVYLNNTWYHIDLTWDDPVYTNGYELTIHDYFMLTTDKLLEKNDDYHSIDPNIYDFIK